MHGLKTVRFSLEAALIRIGLWVLPGLPRAALRGAARGAGAVAFWGSRRLRRITLANLDLAYGTALTPGERRQMGRRTFQNAALVMLDVFWFSRDACRRIRRHVAVEQPVLDALKAGPVIGATAHFGNWELLSKALGTLGFSHMAVAMPQDNPKADALLGAGRTLPGVTIIPRQGAIRKLLRALRQGLHVALLLDQNTKPEEGGLFVQFFGLPCSMSSAAAVLAERAGKPILPLFCRLNGDGNYTIYCRPPWIVARNRSAATDSARAASQAIASLFEEEIRGRPNQWLWMYKRWKYKDPAEPDAAYPFYAKELRRAP